MTSDSVTASRVPTGTWVIDPAHSTVEFQVAHLGLVTVKGFFLSFDGRITVPDDPGAATAAGTVDVASVHTRVLQRDAHLRSPDFFDADRFPVITFESTRIERTDEDLRLTGPLGIRDVRREVVLHGELRGPASSPWGKRLGVALSSQIRRRDFGMTFGWDPGPFPFVGDRVRIVLDIEFVKEGSLP
jgi:polyisoprenoid-binding protein YceI